MVQIRLNEIRRRCRGMFPIILLPLFLFLAIPGSLWAQIPNDLCVDAMSVDCAQKPFGTVGTTVGALATTALLCGTTPGTNAVWYSIMGNGSDIQVDTCSPFTVFDTKLNVYTGDCADQAGMGCIGGNDDAAGSPAECELGSSGQFKLSRISWTSVAGVEYLVVVSGFGGASGVFELILTCEVPVELQRFTIE